jgi:4a-hydroxytetrahydrobiopterin dehydratase
MAMLAELKCTVCREGDTPLTDTEIQKFMQKVPEWQVREEEGVKKLERAFRFDDFADALAFTKAVGKAAEKAGHHPLILTEWGCVTVTWWTHKIKGLHANDFIMAARTDLLYK